jgi:energy-coupling factor transport system substrate-specific component
VSRAVIATAAFAAFAAASWAATTPRDGALALLLLAAALLAAGAAWLDPSLGASKTLALVATLAAAAAGGRVLFAAIPGVQPVTVITVAAGAALGARAGFGVGALAALASNFFLGQGPWTPWQMLAWGGCGVVGAVAAPLVRRRLPFALLCFVLGFAFSGLMDVWEWYSFYPHTWAALTVQLGRGFWFDAAHAIGNVVIALVAGPELRRLLERYGRRLRTEVIWT